MGSPSSREPFSTALPEAKHPPRARVWSKRLAAPALVLTVLAGSAVFYATHNLTRIARWTVRRALPSLRAEVADVKFEAMNRIVIRQLTLRESKTGAELLRLDGGSIDFSFADIRKKTLGEIRLVNPRLKISPDFLNVMPVAAAGGRGGSLPWSVRRIVCDYGEVSFGGFGLPSPDLTFKFAFDWTDPGVATPLGLTLWDLRGFAPDDPAAFLSLDVVRARVTPDEMLKNRRIDSVAVSGGSFLLGTALQKLLSGPLVSSAPSAPGSAWKLGLLDINGVRVRLEDTRETASNVSFQLNTSLREISLAGVASALGEEERTVEIADMEILSPYDPFIKVLTMRRILLHFTLAGLLRKELVGVDILNPSIYVGQDLFWYMDDTQKRLAGDGSNAGGPGWKISTLKVEEGRLLVGSGGRAKYGLPLNFHATASDIALDNLAKLKLQTAFEIHEENYSFPDYQLEVSTKRGDLQFAYPPEKNENNLVGKLFLNTVCWRQFQASDAWLSATFDKTGINGDFGGRVYDGYLSGGFSFLFEEEAPWVGWLYGKGVSFRRLTDVLAPKNFRMTGPVNFKLQMDAFGRNIERVKGNFHAVKPGRMTIGKLDDLLANIPDSWSNLKKSSTRVALESLRDFDYDKADGDLWFVQKQGVFGLKLQGPLGSRNFDIVLHADESNQGRWKDKP